jgi:hypothetical protein
MDDKDRDFVERFKVFAAVEAKALRNDPTFGSHPNDEQIVGRIEEMAKWEEIDFRLFNVMNGVFDRFLVRGELASILGEVTKSTSTVVH